MIFGGEEFGEGGSSHSNSVTIEVSAEDFGTTCLGMCLLSSFPI